jgi:hypothetical protein
MKRTIFLMLTLLIMSVVSVNAQVTIGNDVDPHSGALLDLSQNGSKNRGFLLPQVELADLNTWSLPGDSVPKPGMVVYNTNEALATGEGVYVWTKMLSTNPEMGYPVSGIIISGSQSMGTDGYVNLTATVVPSNASNPKVSWSAEPEGIVTVNEYGKVSGTETGYGKVIITATATDGSGVEGTWEIDVRGFTDLLSPTYRTYYFGEQMGIWMIDNSKEGNPIHKQYDAGGPSEKPEGERGYYYTWAETQSACPAGWRLPSLGDFLLWEAFRLTTRTSTADGVAVNSTAPSAGRYVHANASPWSGWGALGAFAWSTERILTVWGPGVTTYHTAAADLDASAVRCIKE